MLRDPHQLTTQDLKVLGVVSLILIIVVVVLAQQLHRPRKRR
jgi:hypothetical protein